MHVLVADDDVDILATLADQLALQGLHVDCAANGKQVLTLTQDQRYDVIVLDVMMPKLDGLGVCKALRQRGVTTPILLLTARDTLNDKVAGFSSGADDYLIKPFAMQELVCRVAALGKRVSYQGAQVLRVGELCMDLTAMTVTRAGCNIKLNRLQYKILQQLMLCSPRVVSRGELEAAVWQDKPPESDALRSHLYQLRLLVDKPFSSAMITTARGLGVSLQGCRE